MARADFSEFVVVVTGASTGLGRAICVEVASRGAKAVIINYARSEKEANDVAANIKKAGGEAVMAKADLGKPAEIPGLFAAALKAKDKFRNKKVGIIFSGGNVDLDRALKLFSS